MTIDPTIIPGVLLLAAELVALAVVGFVIVRVALQQTDDRMALAQGLVVGLALWGLIVNFVMYAVPGLAGAIVGWGLVLALGVLLVWRAPRPIRPQARVVAGFLVAVLALFWVALASRQLLGIADVHMHLQLAATIRAGGFPPELPWSPGMPAPYHYGEDLLVGLLTPPFGPDLAFVTEVLGAYTWTSLMAVLVTALLRHASAFAVAVSVPLLLGYSTWAQTGDPVNIAQIPVATGIPSAGLRASLADIYWPSPLLPNMNYGVLPNVWKISVTLSYALAFVVLERAALADRRSWPGMLLLAGLVGFVGLLATTLAPVVLVLWASLEAVDLRRLRRTGASLKRAALRAGSGPAAGCAHADGWRSTNRNPHRLGTIGIAAGVEFRPEALGGARDICHASGRRGPAGCRATGRCGCSGGARAAQSTGCDAGGRHRRATASLARPDLSSQSGGREPLRWARPQSGARGTAVRSQCPPYGPATRAVAQCRRRAAARADHLADDCVAGAESPLDAAPRRRDCQWPTFARPPAVVWRTLCIVELTPVRRYRCLHP